jgi:hypothetical protein
MKRLFIAAALALGMLWASVPALAHHAFAAEFDRKKPITLVGTLSKVEWVNPHTWFHIAVTDAKGKVVTWRVEGGAPNQLMRRGWNRDSIKLGDKVTVEGFAARSGEPIANATQIKAQDGRVFGAASSVNNTN